MAIFGFDFGTTNSLVSIIQGGRAISFLDDEDLPVPSVVCYEGGKTIVGRGAKERLAEAGLGIHGNIIKSPKTLLGQESAFVEGINRSPVDIVSEVIRYVSQQVSASPRGRKLGNVTHAVVTIPVGMVGYQRVALRDAFRKAGISIVQFIHEPHAALYAFFRCSGNYDSLIRQYERKLLLVFDWGGGTLDLTLCQLINGMLVQVVNDGTNDVGGDVFDEILKNEIVQRELLSRGIQEQIQVHPDANVRMLHRCERSKIDLSTRNKVEIYISNYFQGITQEDLAYTLHREEMEEIISPLLDKGLARIDKLLESANVSSSQIDLCLVTGGMANMPAIKARLHEWFGPQRVHVPDEKSGTMIAEGAAWVAADQAKLHLAKNVELVLARDSFLPLIKSGSEMPVEGEVRRDQFHLYCTDPRDGTAKFQIQAPVRHGSKVLPSDRRIPLENITIEVDRLAKPFRERLELDVEIDDNLILKAKARALNIQSYSEVEVHNLEFGLSLPHATKAFWLSEEDTCRSNVGIEEHLDGGLSVRSNVANTEDKRLVPGELLASYDSAYFDTRNNPPEIQVEENLYYEPCAVCGRSSNDPLCCSFVEPESK